MQATLFTTMFLLVSITAGVAAMWLLSRIDTLSPGRRLGRRGLPLLSVLAAAAITLSGPEWVRGGGAILSMFSVMALSIAASVVHYRQRTGMLVYQLELAVIWWLWLGCVFLLLWRFHLGW